MSRSLLSSSNNTAVIVWIAASATASLAAVYYMRRKRSGDNNDDSDRIIGPRGRTARQPFLPYFDAFLTCLEDQCHPETRPQGHIALCVAENKLALDLIAQRFMQGAAVTGFGDSSVFTYNDMTGMPVARQAAAYFLARRFWWPHQPNKTETTTTNTRIDNDTNNTTTTIPPDAATLQQIIQPQHIALGAGCAALINHVFFLIGDPQQRHCCLIPRPYYAAFENDMRLIAGIQPFGIAQTTPAAGPTVEDLQRGYQAARRQGLCPKFLLLTNPNNPLGTIYSADTIRSAVAWARARDLHVVVDEIYALSVHNNDSNNNATTHNPNNKPTPFESVISVLDNQLSHDVHVLWAVSKDFGASGLRCGLVYSQNKVLLQGLQSMSVFTCVSGPIQYMIAELLTDDAFCDYFLNESNRRLAASYQICATKLDEMVIPFVPAAAGLFCFVNFSSLLPETTFDWEQVLSRVFFHKARIVLTPGESQRDPQPGMFRICYAWVAPDVLEIAMERLSRLVSKLRRLDLEDWRELATATQQKKDGNGVEHDRVLDRAFAGILD